jgi:hypothetical protein
MKFSNRLEELGGKEWTFGRCVHDPHPTLYRDATRDYLQAAEMIGVSHGLTKYKMKKKKNEIGRVATSNTKKDRTSLERCLPPKLW